jgi:hypothetical protein
LIPSRARAWPASRAGRQPDSGWRVWKDSRLDSMSACVVVKDTAPVPRRLLVADAS